MARPSTRTQLLLTVGFTCFLMGIVADSFLHLPDVAIFSLLGIGIVCMFAGTRAAKRERRGEPAVPFDQRHKRFATVFASLVVGFIGGYFLVRHDHPDFSVTLSVLMCVFGLLFATVIIAWQIYRPRDKKT